MSKGNQETRPSCFSVSGRDLVREWSCAYGRTCAHKHKSFANGRSRMVGPVHTNTNGWMHPDISRTTSRIHVVPTISDVLTYSRRTVPSSRPNPNTPLSRPPGLTQTDQDPRLSRLILSVRLLCPANGNTTSIIQTSVLHHPYVIPPAPSRPNPTTPLETDACTALSLPWMDQCRGLIQEVKQLLIMPYQQYRLNARRIDFIKRNADKFPLNRGPGQPFFKKAKQWFEYSYHCERDLIFVTLNQAATLGVELGTNLFKLLCRRFCLCFVCDLLESGGRSADFSHHVHTCRSLRTIIIVFLV